MSHQPEPETGPFSASGALAPKADEAGRAWTVPWAASAVLGHGRAHLVTTGRAVVVRDTLSGWAEVAWRARTVPRAASAVLDAWVTRAVAAGRGFIGPARPTVARRRDGAWTVAWALCAVLEHGRTDAVPARGLSLSDALARLAHRPDRAHAV